MNNQRRTVILQEIARKGYDISTNPNDMLDLVGLKLKIHFLNPKRHEAHKDFEYLKAFVQINAVLELEESTELIIAPGLFDAPAAISLRFSNGDSGLSSESLLVRKNDTQISIAGGISQF